MSKPPPSPTHTTMGPGRRALWAALQSPMFSPVKILASTENENGGKNLFPFGPKNFFFLQIRLYPGISHLIQLFLQYLSRRP